MNDDRSKRAKMYRDAMQKFLAEVDDASREFVAEVEIASDAALRDGIDVAVVVEAIDEHIAKTLEWHKGHVAREEWGQARGAFMNVVGLSDLRRKYVA